MPLTGGCHQDRPSSFRTPAARVRRPATTTADPEEDVMGNYDDAKTEARKAQGRMEEKADRAGDTMRDKFEDAKDKVGDMADKAKDKLDDIRNR
jgi:hypothetical protein